MGGDRCCVDGDGGLVVGVWGERWWRKGGGGSDGSTVAPNAHEAGGGHAGDEACCVHGDGGLFLVVVGERKGGGGSDSSTVAPSWGGVKAAKLWNGRGESERRRAARRVPDDSSAMSGTGRISDVG